MNKSIKSKGGAINSQNSTLNIKNSNFTENNSREGGAISCIDCKLNIYHVIFSDNKAIKGGALSIKNDYNNTSNITSSSFINNSVTSNKKKYSCHGGAIAISTMTMVNTSLYSIQNVNVTIDDTLFEMNNAFCPNHGNGGSIYLNSNSSYEGMISSHLEITNSHMISNMASHNGGAMFLLGTIALNMENVVFKDNVVSNGHGAVLYANVSQQSINSMLYQKQKSSLISSSWLKREDLLYVNNVLNDEMYALLINMKNVIFNGNRALNGNSGTLSLNNGIFTSMFNNYFKYNYAYKDAGCIELNRNSLLYIYNSTFTNNTAAIGNGGVITITDVIIIFLNLI